MRYVTRYIKNENICQTIVKHSVPCKMTAWHLKSEHFNNIRNGTKTYEVRVFDKKRREINVNDKLTMIENNTNNKFDVIVEEITLYKTFKEAILYAGLQKVLPSVVDLDSAVELYESFPGYKENAKKYGVVCFKLKVVLMS